MLGWRVTAPLTAQRGRDTLVGTFKSARGDVSVEMRPVEPGHDTGGRRAGSLARVELELGSRSKPIPARVTRQP